MTARRGAILATMAVLGIAALSQGTGRLSGHGFGFGRSDDCTLEQSPAEGGATRVLAQCDWDTPITRLDAMIRNWEGHDLYFSNLAESKIVDQNAERVRVRQVQTASGISDREVVVDWRVETVPGGYRYSWDKAPDQSAASGSRVEVERTKGFWEITSRGEKSHLRYSVEYLPGGNVPTFLLRMFQSSGIRGVLADLRGAADTTQVAQSD